MKKLICINDENEFFKKGVVYEYDISRQEFLKDASDSAHSWPAIFEDALSKRLFEEFKFEVGDIVSHVLYDGEFELLSNDCEKHPTYQQFSEKVASSIQCFDENGKCDIPYDKSPIHFIRRPSLEVKESNEVVLYEFMGETAGSGFLTEQGLMPDGETKQLKEIDHFEYAAKIPNGRKLVLDLDTWELSEFKDGNQ